MEKVSIIVPVYNAEKTLDKCVTSLLLQTYKNLEIILIDDGSNDKSLSILNSFYNDHQEVIKVITQENSGVAHARNTGLEAATGNYMMFVDSDDYLDYTCVEKILLKATQNHIDITRFKLTYKYSDGKETVEKDDFPHEMIIEKKDFKNLIYDKILSGIKMNSICRTLYKSEIIKHILFREDMITAEDLIFNIEAFTRATSFLYLPYPYYYYYQSNKGLTGNGISILTKYKCNFIVSTVILKHLKKWNMFHLKYILKAVFRLLFITVSKFKRSFLKNV